MDPEEEESQLSEAILEAEICAKFKCYQKALEHLDRVLQTRPDDELALEAREKVLLEMEENDRVGEVTAADDLESASSFDLGQVLPTLEVSREQELLDQTDQLLTQIYDSQIVSEILKVSAESLAEIMRADRCLIITTCRGNSPVRCEEHCREGISTSLANHSAKLCFHLMENISKDLSPIVLPRALTEQVLVGFRPLLELLGIQSLLAFPLIHRQELLGVIVLHYCETARWEKVELGVLSTVAEHVALALDHIQQSALELEPPSSAQPTEWPNPLQ